MKIVNDYLGQLILAEEQPEAVQIVLEHLHVLRGYHEQVDTRDRRDAAASVGNN